MTLLLNRKSKQLSPFTWKPLSPKQVKVMTWWMPESPYHKYDAIIADGAVRSGKTVSMAFSYIMWAMESFNEQEFIIAGKTIGAVRRNVVGPLRKMLRGRGYQVHDSITLNVLTIKKNGKTNLFRLFGGKDEQSYQLVQGFTSAGVFFDEVALMPQSFVDQALARCSIEGRKFWFNCNPAGPYHWFKVEWLDDLINKRALHLHFTMDDNYSLTEAVKAGYRRLFKGLFYKRYILGLWVLAEGVIYDMFNQEDHVVPDIDRSYTKYYVSCDYGTKNPMTFGLWGLSDKVWYKIKEYHYSGRDENRQKDNEEYYKDLLAFVGGVPVVSVIVDPSATSWIATIKKYSRFKVVPAKNDVRDGITSVASALANGLIKYCEGLSHTFREYSSYIWDQKAADRGVEQPIKQNDHHMDGDRYFVYTIIQQGANPLERIKNLLGR